MRLLCAFMAVACWYGAAAMAAWHKPGIALAGLLGGFAWLLLSLRPQ